jgi:hypothetical protein
MRKAPIQTKPVVEPKSVDDVVSRALYEKEAAQDLDMDEEAFNIEAALAETVRMLSPNRAALTS